MSFSLEKLDATSTNQFIPPRRVFDKHIFYIQCCSPVKFASWHDTDYTKLSLFVDIFIPPANEFAGVYSDPYVRPLNKISLNFQELFTT